MKIGGRARFFVRASHEHEIIEAVRFARSCGLDIFVLGGGSNVLISDKGFEGVVLQIGLLGTKVQTLTADSEKDRKVELEIGDSVSVTVGAGENWDEFVAFCVRNDLSGVECLSGIPGFVGGTPVQNVGAYGQEVAESIVSVRCLDLTTDEFIDLTNDDCGFSYRTSIFNSVAVGRYIVTAVTFSLKKNGEPKIVYKDISQYFGRQKPSLNQVRNAVLEIRREKSMVIDDGDPNSKSAGSFFKNPIVSKQKFAAIAAMFEHVPCFPVNAESVKIPAAWLIENAGFHKGYVMGEAGISSKHTLAIINLGSASSADIMKLKEEIQRAVEAKFGVGLTPEPIFIGF